MEDPTRQPLPAAEDYQPTDAERQLVDEVNGKYTTWRENRRPHEVQWYINAAFIRGLQWVTWNDALSKLEVREVPSHRIRLTINRILSKYKARQAKFLKNRRRPIIVPASTDREDKLDAEATQQSLEYLLRKEHAQMKYRQALAWSMTTGKGFWWFYWDKSIPARVADPKTGKPTDVVSGDAVIDVGSPFEVLVKDPGLSTIGQQPEIMRVKMVELEALKRQYPKQTAGMKADSSVDELFTYEKQIAGLSPKGASSAAVSYSEAAASGGKEPTHVLRKEHFIAPCGAYPLGRYTVVAGDRLMRTQNELPYQFHRDRTNPYPVVEFVDIELAGQFWATTYVEQLIGLQKEYNLIRSKVSEQIKLMAHPKVIAAVQCQWPKNAWTSEPGEVIRILLPPGIPEPKIVHPPNIAQDAWNAMNLIRQEFDEITTLHPASQGAVGQATSGFQTNLLQEAADSVHAPDIESHDLAFEQACYKLRALMQQGYDVPRLIAISGRNNIPDVLEFSAARIDEHAEIIVYTGSALSNSPSVKTQQVIELWNAEILGDRKNPETQRRALGLIDSGGLGELQEERRRDEEKARLENLRMSRDQFVNPPIPFDDHDVHFTIHTDQMKSPEFEVWPAPKQQELFAHTLVHGKYINPAKAVEVAIDLGMPPAFVAWLNPASPQQPAQPPVGAPTPQGPPQIPSPPQMPPMGPQGPQAGPPQGMPPMPPMPPSGGPMMPPPEMGLPGPPPAPPGPGMMAPLPPSPGIPQGMLPMGGTGLMPPVGIPQGMPPFVPPPLPMPGADASMGQVVPFPAPEKPEAPKRRITRIVRDPKTNLIVGAESIEESLDAGSTE